MLPIRPEIENLAPYQPGKPASELKRELGLERVVKLASNENPLGPSPKAVAVLSRPEAWAESHRYLDPYDLREGMAKLAGVGPDQILLGNGSDEIILLLAMTYLRGGDNIVTSEYEFVRYRMNAMIAGAETLQAPLREDWSHDVRALAALVNDRTRALFIANPTNPVGSMVPHSDIVWLIENVPPRVLVVVDEAYHGYVERLPGYATSIPLLEKHPNLVVTRTFSKVYGLASLRAGFAAASPEIVRDANRVRPPFNINRAAMAAALAAMDDHEHVRRSVEANEAGKAWFREFLREAGAEHVDPVANFFLLKVEPDAQAFCRALMERGVIVRPMTGYGLAQHVRVSIGSPEENEAFAEAYRGAMAGAA